MSGEPPLLSVKNLHTKFGTDRGTVTVVDGVSFEIERGETYGFVGESGAGKTVTGMSIMSLINRPGRIVEGEILFKNRDILQMSKKELRQLRGDEIAMVFQDALSALNPSYTIGSQLVDVITEHKHIPRKQARQEAVRLLADVGIPGPESQLDNYPHQLSGGMRQRVLIAMALSCGPDLVIADEPTTALDVTIQAQILDKLAELQQKYGLSILLITHDMGVIAEMCDRVAVMYAGSIVEEGSVDEIFNQPKHPYTLGLLKAIPRPNDPREKLDTIPGNMPDLIDKPSGCSFRDRCPHAIRECARDKPNLLPIPCATKETNHTSACIRVAEIDFTQDLTPVISRRERRGSKAEVPIIEVQKVRKYFTPESQAWYMKYLGKQEHIHAVEDVSLTIHRGETLGLVGESGCGKSTLGRLISRIYDPDLGKILFAGTDISSAEKSQLQEFRSDLQLIFQDPFSSLNPRRTVKSIIGRPMEIHGLVNDEDALERAVADLLSEVGLDPSHRHRYPHEFSGGQKQRIAIARALAVEPDVIIADEPVSALDASVQAKIINLLIDLQDKRNLTFLFIAHDLNVVQHIADRIAVMYLGGIVEIGTTEEIFDSPSHPYTKVLLSSIPQPDPDVKSTRIIPKGEPPSPVHPPSGCRFHTRCPYAIQKCQTEIPESIVLNRGHLTHCHLYDPEVMAQVDKTREEIFDAVESEYRKKTD